FIKDGTLFRHRTGQVPQKIILDTGIWDWLLKGAHEKTGHCSIAAITETSKLQFYWPSLPQDVDKHVKSCYECQL
ncbi:hypothetical protein PENSPDRAFT_539341, partial [Peniophora sp. CONT]